MYIMADVSKNLRRRSINELSVIVPTYNEERSVNQLIGSLSKTITECGLKKTEIIVVDDASSDGTNELLKNARRRGKINKIVEHEENMGYGASLKSGIRISKYKWILIIDADSTYNPADIPKLIERTDFHDMVVGSRTKRGAKVPLARVIPKRILLVISNFLTGEDIKDLNSGLRIFKKRLAFEFWHLLPQRFSFTSTITLASHLKRYKVCYVPISYRKRIGDSSIKPSDFLYFFTLIIRLVVYFNPLKFFFWPGIFLLLVGGGWVFQTMVAKNDITDSGLLMFLLGVQTTFFGLIADLIVRTRENTEKRELVKLDMVH
jgi:glycosyltransferase involved in cell wall biosynthesis